MAPEADPHHRYTDIMLCLMGVPPHGTPSPNVATPQSLVRYAALAASAVSIQASTSINSRPPLSPPLSLSDSPSHPSIPPPSLLFCRYQISPGSIVSSFLPFSSIMATPAAGPVQTTPETPIVVKVAVGGNNRKFKLALKDLNAATLPKKLRSLLQIAEDEQVIFERFSDSSASFITLDTNNPSTYKQLYRAAKAKLKLRIKVTVVKSEQDVDESSIPAEDPTPAPAQLPDAIIETKSAEAPKPLPIVLQPEPFKVAPIGNKSISATYLHEIISVARNREKARSISVTAPSTTWQVYCNSCDKILSDAHFHCGICDKGDYDLCESCVDAGNLCHGEDHWLIKRFIKDGKVVNSTTEKVAPKIRSEKTTEVPGAFTAEVKTEDVTFEASRTCNSCVRVLPEKGLLTCVDCPDYDLCVPCTDANKHGHHPGHTFEPVVAGSDLKLASSAKKVAGRGTRHHAICDGCDKTIYGIRHKCLDCPDWDFCSVCYGGARNVHPGHRFVPLYESIQTIRASTGCTYHHGIYCDGPLCVSKPNQSYITGLRYKCAICHDTDFCANCEAHPKNKHNATHPMIKFKTQVRGVSVQTIGDDGVGQRMPMMGDRIPAIRTVPVTTSAQAPSTKNASTETLPVYTSVAPASLPKPAQPLLCTDEDFDGLAAHFVRDRVPDGTKLTPGTNFYQTWIIKNPGPKPWPAGCSVKFVGGDYMLWVDRTKAVSMTDLESAQQSNTTDFAVAPSDEGFSFTVKLRAPAREGKHISYWRLKTSNGVPFGHKLWCDIDVKTEAADTTSAAGEAQKTQTQPAAFRRPAQQMRAMVRDRERTLRAQRFPFAAFDEVASGLARADLVPAHAESSASGKSATAPAANNIAESSKSNVASSSTPKLQDLALVEHSELRDLVEKQRKRRESTQAATMDAEAKASIMQACAVADNQEARALIDRQQKRRQAMRPTGEFIAPPAAWRQPGHSTQQMPASVQQMMKEQTQRHLEERRKWQEVHQNVERQHQIRLQNQAIIVRMQAEAQAKARAVQSPRSAQQHMQPQPPNYGGVRGGPFSSEEWAAPGSQIRQMMDRLRSVETTQRCQRLSLDQHQRNIGKAVVSPVVPPPIPAKEPMQHQPMAHHEAAAAAPVTSFPAVEAEVKPVDLKTEAAVEAKKPKPATVEDAVAAEEAEPLATSQMVFPTLEKDGSPASSTHEIAAVPLSVTSQTSTAAPAVGVAPSTAATQTIVDDETAADQSDEEEFEDVSNVDLYDDATTGREVGHEAIESEDEDEDEDDDDEGFDTDEYDILDASDEEIVQVGRGAF